MRLTTALRRKTLGLILRMESKRLTTGENYLNRRYKSLCVETKKRKRGEKEVK